MESNIIKVEEKKEVMKAFLMSPVIYAKNISTNIRSIREVFDAHPIQLSEWRREHKGEIEAVLIRFIEGMIGFFGFPKESMTNSQIIMVVNSIMEKYYYFRIEDVCLCFKKAREDSRYKGFYSRMDASVIMTWFAMYDKEREEAVHSLPSDYKAPVYTGEECSREEYKEILLAKMAGGDLYANEAYQRIVFADRMFNADKGVYNDYKYWRKHRFDDKK